jgi:hypothetical protein
MATASSPDLAGALGRRLLDRPVTSRLLAVTLIAAAAISIVAAAYPLIVGSKKNRSAESAWLEARLRVMQEHLATKSGSFVILAGDSHAELLGWSRICGREVVNLGVSGISATHYPRILARLKPAGQAEAAILFIGTNDLARALRPDRYESLEQFRAQMDVVLGQLARFAKEARYAPLLPPADDSRAQRWLDVARAPLYRAAAEGACAARGCRTIPLEQAAITFREDGIHADRASRLNGSGLHAAVEAALCPADASIR